MGPLNYTLVTDRGGHLHNALQLTSQMSDPPSHLVTTYGPDVDYLAQSSQLKGCQVHSIFHMASWWGKKRFWNPFKIVVHFGYALWLVLQIKPRMVVSVGAANVIFFCYWARLFGAKIYHVECMNQVFKPSITGKVLYPISEKVYVQWRELLSKYGPKAVYEGWVL